MIWFSILCFIAIIVVLNNLFSEDTIFKLDIPEHDPEEHRKWVDRFWENRSHGHNLSRISSRFR